MEVPNSTLIIAGFMGVGKTSVARYLASSTGCSHADLDEVIHTSSGLTSGEYIRLKGEDSFREYELATLVKLLSNPPKIIALGGGTLHIDGVLDILRDTCLIVIEASYDIITERVKNTDRPMVKSGLQLYEYRKSLFKSMPLLVDSTNASVHQCSMKILDLWSSYENV